MTSYTPEDYIKYRIDRAIETLDEVSSHIDNMFWNTSINRMYYACFYAVSALLAKHKIDSSSHSGVRLKLGQHFVKTGIIDRDLAKLYTELFEKRQKGDYNDFFDYTEEEIRRLYPLARAFIFRIKELLNE